MLTDKRAKREAKKLFRECQVNSVLDEQRARQTVQGLIAVNQQHSRAVLREFMRRLSLYAAEHRAEIESAAPLTDDLKTEIEGNLTRQYGQGLTFAFSHRPELAGGMRIRIGSDVYDGSVRAALEKLLLNGGPRVESH
jgi:F-type H+-transporting ATPase subunit delta